MRAIGTRLSVIAILFWGLLGLTKMHSQPVGKPSPCPHHQKMAGMQEAEKLEISPEQEKAMHKLRLGLHKEIAPLRIELETKELELEELWLEDKPDVEKIVKKVQEIHKIQGQIREKEIRHQFEVNKILKPEQQRMFRRRCGMSNRPFARIGLGRCGQTDKKCPGCE